MAYLVLNTLLAWNCLLTRGFKFNAIFLIPNVRESRRSLRYKRASFLSVLYAFWAMLKKTLQQADMSGRKHLTSLWIMHKFLNATLWNAGLKRSFTNPLSILKNLRFGTTSYSNLSIRIPSPYFHSLYMTGNEVKKCKSHYLRRFIEDGFSSHFR